MHLYGALVLLVTVSAACGLSCYNCQGQTCTDQLTCPVDFDRCSSVTVGDVIIKSCTDSKLCADPIMCCSTDLCNGAVPTGNSAIPTDAGAIPTGPGAIPTDTGAIPTPGALPTRNGALLTRNGAIPTGNVATPTGSSVLLLLASSAIITLFL